MEGEGIPVRLIMTQVGKTVNGPGEKNQVNDQDEPGREAIKPQGISPVTPLPGRSHSRVAPVSTCHAGTEVTTAISKTPPVTKSSDTLPLEMEEAPGKEPPPVKIS